MFLSVFGTCLTETRSTINIVATSLLNILIKAVYSSNASTRQNLANQINESREMASYQPLLYQPTPSLGCQCSISHAQHALLTEHSSIRSTQDSISSQVPRCLATLQAHEICSPYGQAPQFSKIPPSKGPRCPSAHWPQECSPNHQQIPICDPWWLPCHVCYGLEAGVYRSVCLDKRTDTTSSNKKEGPNDPGSCRSMPVDRTAGGDYSAIRTLGA